MKDGEKRERSEEFLKFCVASSQKLKFHPIMRYSFMSLSFAVALDALQSNFTSNNVSAFVVAPHQKLVYVNPLHAVSVEPLSQLTAPDEITDAPLMRDIEMLNNMLAEVVERDNPVVHDLYTRFRRHGTTFSRVIVELSRQFPFISVYCSPLVTLSHIDVFYHRIEQSDQSG